MKHNYQLDTDAAIASLGDNRPKLLLQCCCGPCSSYVLEYLTRHFDITILFFNPNIQPMEEYSKRLYWLREVAVRYGGQVKTLECGYDGERFDKIAEGLENEEEGGERCTECFKLRLEETARLASDNGFDWFCSTLTVSPHKDCDRINEIGLAYGRQYEVQWLPSDFKKREGYKRSTELSREYGLYRQDYCGCLYSLAQSKNFRKTEIYDRNY